MEGVLTLDDADLQGRTVLFRVDVNSPIEPSSGQILDDGRLSMCDKLLLTTEFKKLLSVTDYLDSLSYTIVHTTV